MSPLCKSKKKRAAPTPGSAEHAHELKSKQHQPSGPPTPPTPPPPLPLQPATPRTERAHLAALVDQFDMMVEHEPSTPEECLGFGEVRSAIESAVVQGDSATPPPRTPPPPHVPSFANKVQAVRLHMQMGEQMGEQMREQLQREQEQDVRLDAELQQEHDQQQARDQAELECAHLAALVDQYEMMREHQPSTPEECLALGEVLSAIDFAVVQGDSAPPSPPEQNCLSPAVHVGAAMASSQPSPRPCSAEQADRTLRRS